MDQITSKTEDLSIFKRTLYDYGLLLFKKANWKTIEKFRKTSRKKKNECKLNVYSKIDLIYNVIMNFSLY